MVNYMYWEGAPSRKFTTRMSNGQLIMTLGKCTFWIWPGKVSGKSVPTCWKQGGTLGGVMNGKIYVFGGENQSEYVRGCEVYDPKEYTWSSITPMKAMRSRHHVVTIGEELFVLGGDCCETGYDLFRSNSIGNDKDPSHDTRYLCENGVYTKFAEVYHPGKGEWRLVRGLVNPFSLNYEGRYFFSQGSLFVMSDFGIYACEVDITDWSLMRAVNSEDWSFMHYYSYPEGFTSAWCLLVMWLMMSFLRSCRPLPEK